jgi:hypothetical protein
MDDADGKPRNSPLDLLLPLLVLAWLVVPPWLFYGGMIMGAAFFGEQPSPDELAESAALFRWAGLAAAALPLAGLVLSRWLRRRSAARLFAVLLVIGSAGAVLCLAAAAGL